MLRSGGVRPAAAARLPAARLQGRGRLRVLAGASISSNDFKPGVFIEVDGAPFKVVEHMHVKPGKGAAFVRTKLKNQVTGASFSTKLRLSLACCRRRHPPPHAAAGNTVEKTFRAGEKVDSADMNKTTFQFTYTEADQYVFMNLDTFEETRMARDDSWAKFLKEGMQVQVLTWNGRVIDVEVPNTVTLKVVDTAGSDKGNTASGGASKPATLETGAVVQVPMFITTGEDIVVDTRQSIYLSRPSGSNTF